MKRLSLCFAFSLLLAGCGSSTSDDAPGTGGEGGAPASGGAGQGGEGSGGAASGGSSSTGGSSNTGGGSAVCDLPFDAGLCLAAFPVFTFDSDADECIQATYGGCGGNENRFDTKEECEAACSESPEAQDCSAASECGACLELKGCSWTANQCASECLQDAACFGPGNSFAPACPG